jgi:hypothetical protein
MSKMTFEQYRDKEGFPLNSTQERLWRKCWNTAQRELLKDFTHEQSYSEGSIGDGAAILYNGQMLKVDEIISHLNTNLAYAEMRGKERNDLDERLTRALIEVNRLERELEQHREVTTSRNVLVKQLDDLLNGAENAAAAPSLCDIVSQVAHHVRQNGGPLLGETPFNRISQQIRDVLGSINTIQTNLDFNTNKVITQIQLSTDRLKGSNIPGPR